MAFRLPEIVRDAYEEYTENVLVTTPLAGADPGFFLGGGAPLRNDVTDR